MNLIVKLLTLFRISILFFVVLTVNFSCKKEHDDKLFYYEVGMKNSVKQWQDSSFIVATANNELIQQIEAELLKPVMQRKMISGDLMAGSGGYNKNAAHEFKWHFNEQSWGLVDITVEIYDGRPYSDVDADTAYWLQTVKRFAPWDSYIKRKINSRQ